MKRIPVLSTTMRIPDPIVQGAEWLMVLDGERYFVKSWIPPIKKAKK